MSVPDLPSLSEFRRIRDEYALASARARLTDLEAQITPLRRAYLYGQRKIRQETNKEQKKHLSAELYAKDGFAWRWARCDADIADICRAIPMIEQRLKESLQGGRMSDMERKVLEAVRELRHDFERVYPYHVGMKIEKSERMARYYLERLEERRLVTRCGRQRCGWAVA